MPVEKPGGTQQLYHNKPKLLSQSQYNSLTLHGAPGAGPHAGPATPGFKAADAAAMHQAKLINLSAANDAQQLHTRQTSGQ